ncbi:MAG: hypothetical protein HY551_03530 [Elusimicrobia bacterium]|nr:hypothetical protein [Elusimicrobiota bacterium]
MKMRSLCLTLGALAVFWAPGHGADVLPWFQTFLWQEHFLWDALMTARDRVARQTADPHLLPVVRAIAQQTAQQSANLQQIQFYAKAQQDNLRFAFNQTDPTPSLATIRSNLETLQKGVSQIRHNLYYLTARTRMASSQALPDPELMKTATLLINQIQASQMQLNSLYADAVAVQSQLATETWLRDKPLRYQADLLVRATANTQDAIFSIYNSSYELYLRSK